MNIFVTGGTGFIGSYVVHELVGQGHTVTILARNAEKVSGLTGNPLIEIVEGTLYDNEVIKNTLSGKDACIHIALGWGDTALDMLEADTKPSIYIFETAARLGIKKMIYTSSTAAMGDFSPTMDETTRVWPNNFYGATKAATEAYFLGISHVYGAQCNIIRPGYTFGNPVVEGGSMEPDTRFKNIVDSAKKNQPIHLIKNDGTQFIWAGDLARLYASVIESEFNREMFFGLGTEYVSWEKIARYAIEITGSKSDIILEDKGYIEEGCMFDLSLMDKKLGCLFTSWERIKEHVRYYAEHIV